MHKMQLCKLLEKGLHLYKMCMYQVRLLLKRLVYKGQPFILVYYGNGNCGDLETI